MSALPQSPARPAPRARHPRPQLRVVGAPRHHRRYAVLLLAVAAAGVFGIVSLNALAAESAFAARALEREVSELSLQAEELTARVAELESPERVRAVALTELGMVPAEDATFVRLERAATAQRNAVGTERGREQALSDPRSVLLSLGG